MATKRNKKIIITIEHNLTPFHLEILMGTLGGTVEAIRRFWTEKSKKFFTIDIKEESWKK